MNPDLELCYLDAAGAIERFRARSLSPVELVSHLIARIEAIEPKVNALTYTFFERALDEARAAELRYSGRGRRPRRLEGVPIVIKDYHDVSGEITTFGSRLYENHRSPKSLAYVDRLLRAGAILLGRSTTPEFALLGVTHSDLWGVTRNPWNLDMTPGGSSGGAGAALAAGMTTLADGSDIGGSIRIPASCCGVFGLKPAHGRVPTGSAGALDPYLAYGPMTRRVADSALMMNVMAGQHRDDPVSVPSRLRPPLVSLQHARPSAERERAEQDVLHGSAHRIADRRPPLRRGGSAAHRRLAGARTALARLRSAAPWNLKPPEEVTGSERLADPRARRNDA